MRSWGMLAGTGLALCLFYGVAAADTVKYTVALSPDKQGGPGKGTANLSIDTATKTLTGTVDYSGLTAPPAMAAFLSPPATLTGGGTRSATSPLTAARWS